MSRGPGTHQRAILAALEPHGWTWAADLPYRSRSDYTSYWRAIRKLEAHGLVRIEYRTRSQSFRRWALLVSVIHSGPATALPIDEPYYPPGTFGSRVELRGGGPGA